MQKLAVILCAMTLLAACTQAPESSSMDMLLSTVSTPPAGASWPLNASPASGEVEDNSEPASITPSSLPLQASSEGFEVPENTFLATSRYGAPDNRQFLVYMNFSDGMYLDSSIIILKEPDGLPPILYVLGRDPNGKIMSKKAGELFFVRSDLPLLTMPPVEKLTVIYACDDTYDFNYSEAEELRGDTYYYHGDILVTTREAVLYGLGVDRWVNITYCHVNICNDFYLVVALYHNLDSIGAKAYVEGIVDNIVIEELE